jgi:hypothetical protein
VNGVLSWIRQLQDITMRLFSCKRHLAGFISHGNVVMNRKEIANHYLGSWFLMDLMSSLPSEIFFRYPSS